MNYLGIDKASISNGPGVRVVLWVSGCSLHCKGCQNPESWDFYAGKLFDETAKQELFSALDKQYVRGITLSGGHPLEYENLPAIYDLTKEIKAKYPNKDIWLYTGYVLSISDFDQSVDIGFDNSLLRNYILTMCDVVVDGPYIEEQRDITLAFCGSKNQRIIDVQKSLKTNEVIEMPL
jgi:anaerobic ribonucleoside-triphosphate reductase activating protein